MVVPTTSLSGTICTSRTSLQVLWPRHDAGHRAVACSCVAGKGLCVPCKKLLFHHDFLDRTKNRPYNLITYVERAPTTTEVRDAGKSTGSTILDKQTDADISNITSNRDAVSLPNDTIYTKEPSNKPLTAHEIEHQSQYQNGNKKDVFERLVGESLDGASGKYNPYTTKGTLEYEAQQVQVNAIGIQQKGGI